jgi:hypothetical protein
VRGAIVARIEPVDLEHTTGTAREVLDADISKHGSVMNTTAIMVHVPEMAAAARRFSAAVAAGTGIADELRLLMNLRVASLIGCEF